MSVQLSDIAKLPSQIVVKLNKLGAGPTGVAQVVEAAITRIIDANGAERFAIMSAALPMMQEARSDLKFSELQTELIGRFLNYCNQKGLRPDVLLTGALLLELGIVAIPNDPDAPDHCR
jgi:hypothetical protein